MKVVLIWAKGQSGYNVSSPLGICYIAAYIRMELKLEPDIIDAHLQRFSVAEVLDKVINNKYAMAYTMKVLVIMSQLGLIKPENMQQYPQEIVPDWQKRYYGISSNLNMNMYLFSRFLRSRIKNLV